MRKSLVSTLLVAAVAGLALFAGFGTSNHVHAQGKEDNTPHKVGLIDMAEVFKNYSKFKGLTDGLKKEVEATTGRIQGLQKEGNGYAQEMKDLKAGSPRHVELEKKILKIQAELGLLKNETQRDLARKEARIYKEVYGEVQEAVAKFASYYKYTLIIRYSSEQIQEDDNPQMVIHKLNKLVVYNRPDDDITKSIVAYLNRKAAGGN